MKLNRNKINKILCRGRFLFSFKTFSNILNSEGSSLLVAERDLSWNHDFLRCEPFFSSREGIYIGVCLEVVLSGRTKFKIKSNKLRDVSTQIS